MLADSGRFVRYIASTDKIGLVTEYSPDLIKKGRKKLHLYKTCFHLPKNKAVDRVHCSSADVTVNP